MTDVKLAAVILSLVTDKSASRAQFPSNPPPLRLGFPISLGSGCSQSPRYESVSLFLGHANEKETWPSFEDSLFCSNVWCHKR